MDGVNTLRWHSLERWSPPLFLIAGGVLIVYAALTGLEAFTDMTLMQKGFEVGYVLGFLGLLGLYPTQADRSPWLARAGAVAAVLGAVAFSVFTVNRLAELAGVVSGDPPGWSVFVVMAAVGFVLGYLAFGVASLRADTHPRVVGLVLLVPAIIVVLMFAHVFAGLDSPGTAFVISAGQAMAHLAIGATLRTKSTSTEGEEPSNDSDPEVVTHD